MGALARFERWLHAPAPAERLAALRIAIGGFVTAYVLVNVREFDRLAGRTADAFEPIGLARLLSTPLSAASVWLVFASLVIGGLAFTAGWRVRLVGPVFAAILLFWTSYHSSWGQLLHFEHLFTLHVLILAFAPTSDAWSVGGVAEAGPSVRYGWPIRLLALATAVTYVLSGIAKLRYTGVAWFEPDTLANHIGYSATRMETVGGRTPPLASTALAGRWLLGPAAALALAVELGAPLALLGRRSRNVWVVAALLFHVGTAATMLVFFGYRGLGFAMLPLFRVEIGVRRVGELISGTSLGPRVREAR